MTPDDTDLLDRLDILASVHPCMVPRDDMLRLITLAGFNPEDVLWADAMGDDDPVIVRPIAVRQMVKLAREAGGQATQ